jgi:molecular chaperone DnaJ
LGPTSPDPYTLLGVSPKASTAEIRAAYRALVKRHHPDAGGEDDTILALNAAWEVLRDGDRRRHFDRHRVPQAGARGAAQAEAAAPPPPPGRGAVRDQELAQWLQRVHAPIDRLLAQVINPFPAQLRSLSADPYDDGLMETFCSFLEQCRERMEKAETLYRSEACPAGAHGFCLSLYRCLSQVQDAVAELERYTMGYVDGYLHDGREMLREARRRRSLLQEERRRLEL